LISKYFKGVFSFLCLVWVVLTLYSAMSMAYEYSGKTISGIEVIADTKDIEKYLYELFRKVDHRAVSYIEIADTISLAQRREDIESITVNTRQEGDSSVILTVVARSKFKPTEIIFEGNKAVDSVKLRDVVAFERDKLADQANIDSQMELLRNYYKARGFLKASITSEKIYTEAKNRGVLQFKIDEGTLCRIKQIDIKGDFDAEKRQEILKILDIRPGCAVDTGILKSKFENLARRLSRKGYMTTKIEDPSIFFNDSDNTASILVNIQLGSKIRIMFKGNHYYFERASKLKDVIRFKEENQFSQTWIEAAKFELERFYKNMGYSLVEITASDKLYADKNERVLTFKINKGNRILIDDIIFKGNKSFDGVLLKKKVLAPDIPILHRGFYVREEFRRALKALIRFYNSQGYLEAQRVGEPIEEYNKRQDRVILTVSLSEGKIYYSGDLSLEGNSFISRQDALKYFKFNKGEPYNPYDTAEGVEKLRTFYLEKGYKYVQIYTRQELADDKASVSIIINEQDRVKIGKISITGNATTEEMVIRRELSIKEGDYYSPTGISQSESNVSRLGLFSSVQLKEEGYDPKTNTVDIDIQLSEKKQRSLKTRIGYGTDEGLRGAAELTFINIAGKGRTLAIGAELSHRLHSENILRRKESISYREPRFFGSKLAGKIGLLDERREEPQFNIDRSALSAGVDQSISRYLRYSLTYNLEYRKPFDLKIDPAELSPFDESRKRLAFFDLTLDWDRRDDIFNASKGFLARFSFDTYSKGLASEHNFLQFYSSNSAYIPIYGRIRSIITLKYGFSTTYGSTRAQGIPIPIEKRFRLGGSYSLRGFPLNSVGGLDPDQPAVTGQSANDQAPGGDSVFNFNAELIFPLPLGFDFVLFTDGGESYKSNWDFNPFDIRNSAGFGLRYNTPVGPIRLDVGFILDRRTGEDWGAIQFAVGLL
jgi:outer membrane protein insertion porin family